jgi:hypothetical protein
MGESDQAKGEHPKWMDVELPPPNGLRADFPWPAKIRYYPPDHPARRDAESTEAFNWDWAVEDFGGAFLGRLKHEQGERKPFKGDWWLLALLRRCEDAAHARDPKGEHRARFSTWGRVRSRLLAVGVGRHLEHADLRRAHLEHADLAWAHLEHADLQEAHLEHADLQEAHLEHAGLYEAHLEHAYLYGAHLEHAGPYGAYLEHADLRMAHLEHARVIGAHLEHAYLFGAHLEHADLRSAHLEHADLQEAVLTGADVRGATGLRFDTNRVRDIHIEGNATDPWSVLRRKYTGPLFFVHAALLVAFILPYIGKVLALTAADHAARALERAPPLPHLADRAGVEIGSIPAWKVLIGLDKAWWVPTLGLVLLLYNLIRGVLTIRVGQLRDAEERSGITPTLGEYMGTQGLEDERWQRFPWLEYLWPRSLWPLLREFGRWLPDKALSAVGLRKERTTRFAKLGLWRLHRLLQALLLIALASFAFHAAHWVWTTTLPKITITPGPSSPSPVPPPLALE